MSADIYEFLANFGGGGQRPNRYEVVVTFPNGIGSVQDSTKIMFTCKASGIPASSMGVAVVPYKGREIKLPGDKVWDDWNVSVLLDTDFLARGVFEDWHDGLLGFESNVTRSDWIDPINCFGSAIVTALGRDDEVTATYNITGIFPVNVGEIGLDYSDNNNVAMQQISFAINGWFTDFTT